MKLIYINFVFVLWLTAITTFSLGIFVIIRSRHNIVNKTFAFYSFSIAWWSFSEIWGIACDNKLTALIWTRIEQVGVFFIPTFFVHFVISLLNIKNRKWLLRLAYFFSSLFAILSFTPFMMANSIPMVGVPYVKHFGAPGFAYHFAILFFIILTIYGLSELYVGYRSSSGARKNQLKYLFWSSLFGYSGGAANFLLVYGISIPILNPFGTYTLPVYISVVTYAILRHRLMDIRVVLTRAGIFIAVYTLVLGLPFAVVVMMRSWLTSVFGGFWWFAPMGLLFLLATIGPFIYIYIDRRAEERLFKELKAQRGYKKDLEGASKTMILVHEPQTLIKMIARAIMQKVKVRHAGILLHDKERDTYVLTVSRGPSGLKIPEGFARMDAI